MIKINTKKEEEEEEEEEEEGKEGDTTDHSVLDKGSGFSSSL